MKIEEIQGLLGLAQRARTLSIGSRETREAMRRREIRLLLVSTDGSVRDRQRLRRVAEEEKVECCEIGSSEELGAAIGRGAVGVLGVRDRNLAAGIIQRLLKGTRRTGQGPSQSGGE